MAFGDWGEMQTVPHVLGVAHPTGYPTYIILSWLAQLVPVGSIAFRSNLLSAVLVSVALAVTAAVMVRLGVRPLLAVAAALALGAVRTVWSAATVAEVNPLHLLFVALLLHRALVWEERRSFRDLVLGALLLGLALGNHLLILFVAPFIVVFGLWVGRREIAAKPRNLLSVAAAGFLGLSVYLYIPIAAGLSPALAYNHPVTPEAMWWLISGTQFQENFGFLALGGPDEFAAALPVLRSMLFSRATPAMPILALLGLIVLVRRRPAFGLTCLAILLMNIYIWATYQQLEHYLLVPWLLIGIGAAVALESAVRALHDRLPWPQRRYAGGLVGAAALSFAMGLAITNWRVSDRSGDRSAETFVDAIFDALPPDAAILSPWDASTPLWHAQLVLDRRPDVQIVDDTNIVFEGWGTRERRIAALICGRPVFIVRLKDRDLQPTGAAYRMEPYFTVRVGHGGPTAVVARQVFRVEPHDPAACGQ